jgi:class 3 adenylate cyclase
MTRNHLKPGKKRGVREVLLYGVFLRILIIEMILLVGSLLYRWFTEGSGAEELFWYGVRIILLVVVIIVFMMLTLRSFLNRRIILPLEGIASANRMFREESPGSIKYVFPSDTPREIAEIVETREQMLNTIMETSEKRLKLMNFVRETFGRYLSQKVVDEILENPDGRKTGGRRETVTILMADLRGFTQLSENRDPEEMVRLLNRYIERMSSIIVGYEGVIDEIMGDGILAVFGVPERQKDDTYRAVASGIAMQNSLLELNEEFAAEGYPALQMGIGINTGSVIVGNIGSEVRMKYGVVGTAINSAAGIQSNAVGGQVLIGETTYLQTGDKVSVRPAQTVMLKGMKRPLVFYPAVKIAAPYRLELKTLPVKKEGFEISLPFHLWQITDKKVVGGEAATGETVQISDDQMVIRTDAGLEPFSNLKLRFEFCLDAHCFEDMYAKVLAAEKEEEEGTCYRVAVTSMEAKDREILKKWMEETRN